MKLDMVTKVFEDKTVFSNFSLEIPENKISVLLGPSGRGKTTLFRLLLGLEVPDSGSVSSTSNPKALFQEDRLLENLSVRNNLLLVSSDRGRMEDLLSRLGLSGEMKSRISTLSGGMRRRVALARVLLTDYDALLLDEPFSGLDDEAKAATARVILEELRGRTLLVITHDEEDAVMLGAENVIRL